MRLVYLKSQEWHSQNVWQTLNDQYFGPGALSQMLSGHFMSAFWSQDNPTQVMIARLLKKISNNTPDSIMSVGTML